jgi:hypothetical protein
MDHVPPYEFQKCVARYNGNCGFRGFPCLDQFLCLAFAQLTFRESLRDIEACLRSVERKLYHMGFRGNVSRSTLADADESHDWRIYADFAQVLIHIARPMYANESLGSDLDNTVYALDSTAIDLCLSVFPWARFRAHKAAIKMHTLLDLLTTNEAARVSFSADKQSHRRGRNERVCDTGSNGPAICSSRSFSGPSRC